MYYEHEKLTTFSRLEFSIFANTIFSPFSIYILHDLSFSIVYTLWYRPLVVCNLIIVEMAVVVGMIAVVKLNGRKRVERIIYVIYL